MLPLKYLPPIHASHNERDNKTLARVRDQIAELIGTRDFDAAMMSDFAHSTGKFKANAESVAEEIQDLAGWWASGEPLTEPKAFRREASRVLKLVRDYLKFFLKQYNAPRNQALRSAANVVYYVQNATPGDSAPDAGAGH